MRGEVDIQRYAQFASGGLFADNVILSILDYKGKGKLNNNEKEALRRAKKFFDNVLEGENLQNNTFSSAHDVIAAKAFNSLQPMKNRLPRSKSITDYISELRDIINEILNDNVVEEQKINQLDNFFTSYSRIHFQQAESVLKAV